MTLEDTINALTDAGFIVTLSYPYVIVSSLNRTVYVNEVWVALNYAELDYSRSGDSVLIRF